MANLATRCTIVSKTPVGYGPHSSFVRATMSAQAGAEHADEVVLKIARPDHEIKLVNELQKLNYLSRQGDVMQKYLVASHGMFELKVDGALGLALVLDHVPGGTLEEHIPSSGIPEVDARPAFQGLFSALELLHAYGVVHMDIHPSSIFCEKKDDGLLNTRLGNFGAAMFLDDAELLVERRGAAGFTAPELLLPSPTLTAKADCFSLGVTLFWAVTGTQLDESKEALNRRGLGDEGTDLSPELEDLLIRLGGADPRRRLSACAALEQPWFKVPQRPARPNATCANPRSKRFR
jgi:serine/threonine protein kinase